MAKSLGQIHTVSNEYSHINFPLVAGNKLLIDLPGELTKQLQHMVRAMSTFKVVGIDMSFGPITGASEVACSMSGQILYYQPTKGRVEALKMAYTTVRKMMQMSGVEPTHAITYDFRPPIIDPAECENGDDFVNQASIENNGLASCLHDGPVGSTNIFSIYNQGILPRQAVGAAPNFQVGYAIGLRSNAASADWVLNPEVLLSSLTDPTAETALESIPFELSYNAADSANQLPTSGIVEWRPDPALYMSVLTGQLIIDIEESAALQEGAEDFDATQLDVSVHVAGWKGILGAHKKRRTRRSKKGKSHGRKRRSR